MDLLGQDIGIPSIPFLLVFPVAFLLLANADEVQMISFNFMTVDSWTAQEHKWNAIKNTYKPNHTEPKRNSNKSANNDILPLQQSPSLSWSSGSSFYAASAASISSHANTNDTLNCRDILLGAVSAPFRPALPTHKAQVSLTNYDDDKISSPDVATELPETARSKESERWGAPQMKEFQIQMTFNLFKSSPNDRVSRTMSNVPWARIWRWFRKINCNFMSINARGRLRKVLRPINRLTEKERETRDRHRLSEQCLSTTVAIAVINLFRN